MKLRVLLLTSVIVLSSLAAPVKSRLASAETDYTTTPFVIPYDAEVEYLESTGTQCFFDSGIYLSSRHSVKCKIYQPGNNSAFGSIPGKYFFGGRTMGNMVMCFWGNKLQRVDQGFIGAHTIVFGQDFTVDGVLYPFDTQPDFSCLGTCGILCRNSSSGGFTANDICSSGTVLYWFQIYDADTLVFDLIPVRFTNDNGETEGAMYDRVSGELFRNQGSGSFIIGPDL